MGRLQRLDLPRRFEALLSVPPFRARPTVSVLRLAGTIGGQGGLRASALDLQRLEPVIARAFRGRGLVAVALAVNSPGGAAVQSSLIASRIRAAADERKVPVIAFAEDVAASGGYWLACAGDEIYAHGASIVGSIGVIAAGFGFQDLIARYGVERRVHTSGPHKGMLDPFRPEQPNDVTRLRAIQDDVFDQFKEMVRTRRAGRLKADEAELFTGTVWSGREALGLGLVDGIGDLRTVMRARFGDRVRFRAIAPRRGLLRRRFGLAAALPEVLAEIDDWALWRRYGL